MLRPMTIGSVISSDVIRYIFSHFNSKYIPSVEICNSSPIPWIEYKNRNFKKLLLLYQKLDDFYNSNSKTLMYVYTPESFKIESLFVDLSLA